MSSRWKIVVGIASLVTLSLAAAQVAGVEDPVPEESRGKFLYRVNMAPTVLVQERYNMLRHAGAIYAMATYCHLRPDATLRAALERAGRYLQAHGRAGLLRELAGCEDWRAEIVSAVAYATPDGECCVYEHRVSGQVLQQEQWTPGLPNWIAPTEESVFGGGYNAVFVPDGETRTLAEIPPLEALGRGYREPNFSALLRELGYV